LFRIPYPASGSCVAVLGLDPIRHAYKLQDRIDVQLQQAHWASLYQKKSIDAEHLLEQLGLTP
jgi:ABC-2 type transport system ATP-binding protein